MQRLSRTVIQLNMATRSHHVEADRPWLDLMVPAVGKHAYVKQLRKVYGFEAPLEAAFRYTPGLSALVDLRARMRSGLIAQDLLRLGMSAGRLADLPQRFTTFANPAEALGWMYVIERATLLHGGVRRYLTQHVPDSCEATNYLAAYDGVAGTRWSELGSAFDAISPSPTVTRQIVRAASAGFRSLCDWFRADESLAPVVT
ncbi:MAG: biliverdin-producing heme oxygenase [Kofleriaceae bacterium]